MLCCLSLCASAQQMTEKESKALQLANDGHYEAAAAGFEAIVATDPKNSNARNMLVQLYDKMGNPQKQYEAAAKGQALFPDDESWNYTCGEAAIKMGKTAEALALADAFTAKYPDSAYLYIIKGLALDAQGKVQLAIAAYSKTIRLHPGNAYAYLCRGKDFATISRYQNAISDFTAIIGFGQEVDEVYNRRGLAYYSLQQYPEAEQDFTKAITLNPANAYAFANRGWIYLAKEDYTAATADFTRSSTIDATYSDAWYGLARTSDKQKNSAAAISYIQKAISLNNKMPVYYAQYSSLLLAADRNAEGLAAANTLLGLEEKNGDGFILKATALSNLKNYDEAVSAITAGINYYPDNYLMYSLRSFIYKQQGKVALAAADTEKAKLLSTKN